MDERTRVLVATVFGAVAGCVVGCLYLTEGGRRIRERIDPAVDAVTDEIQQARRTFDKARAAAAEGRRVIGEVIHPPSPDSEWKSTELH